MPEEFYKESRECHEDRLKDKTSLRYDRYPRLMELQSDFICYYHSNGKPLNADTFRQWLLDCKQKINWHEKMWLLEQNMGIKFEYNHGSKTWVEKKA